MSCEICSTPANSQCGYCGAWICYDCEVDHICE